ncbi:class I SAM-dependent methyltransferase [Actinocrinis puniceicyclus]|uniref:Class I SAM-dependent methyltransferase n=1 Tax=Actinocrinis puniceicyclus TaxID=977794 RepID=A0A8J8BEA4_9ACTN|nr:class I SAM-dependent methyltransferase [Actinocrinis puniceicyclus]MBS2966173.1 class I SAM-dependent methyltransferase [Actinocrinis puniceicyclus]
MNEAVATQAAYSSIAAQYARTWDQVPPWIVEELDRLAGLLGEGARVADLGCGPGRHTRLLRERALRATGFDLSAEMLAALGTPGQVRADMLALPVADAALDGIWCAAALLHIPRTALPAALAEFARVLRRGGELVLAVAEGDGEKWESVPYDVPGHEALRRYYVLHRLESLSALLDTAGFDVYNHWRRVSHRQWLHVHARKR